MLNIGHAIVGDPFYAPESAKVNSRLMLHARELDIFHPSTGERMCFKLAPDF